MFALLFLVVFIGVIVVSVMAYNSKTINIIGNYQENRKNETNICAISFPEYNPEEYQIQKRERNDNALNGCEFWDGLNIDFQENLECLNNKKCPYCGCNLPERKGKSYKCPECKEKIYRLKDLISDFEGLFTQEQKEIREQLKKELSRRKRFWEIYQYAKNYINFVPTNFKNDNIIILLGLLSEARSYIQNKKQAEKLRMCRFFEGQLCMNIEGYEKASLNAFLAVAYIDTWDKICNGKVAPYIIEEIKKFNYNIEILRGLFIGHAQGIAKSIKYKPPLTPDEAWEKFYNQYTKE